MNDKQISDSHPQIASEPHTAARHEQKEQRVTAQHVWHWIKKHYFIILLLIPIIISIYLRTMPAYLPIADEKAEEAVLLGLKGQIENIVNNQYPNLPQQNKDALIKEQYEKYLEEHRVELEQSIEQQGKVYKSFYQDDAGQTYLFELDPWHWYRLAKNYLEHGYEGDLEKNGRYYDMYIYAGLPLDKRSSSPKKIGTFHVLMIVVFYKIASFFNPSIPLTTVAFYVPMIFGVLFIIPAFFIGRKLGGNIGGFFTALLLSFHKALILRTSAGFSDTDGYSIFFPLMIVWMFIEAWNAEKVISKIMLSSAAGTLVGIYSYAWSGWWNIFYFIIIAAIITITFTLVCQLDKNTKDKIAVCLLVALACLLIWQLTNTRVFLFVSILGILTSPAIVLYTRLASGKTLMQTIKNTYVLTRTYIAILVAFIMSGILSVSIVVGISKIMVTFSNLFLAPFNFVRFKAVATSTLWPNVFTTVAEQNSSSVSEALGLTGGRILFFIAITGLFLYLTLYYKNHSAMIVGSYLWIFLFFWLSKYFTSKILFYILFLAVPLVCISINYKQYKTVLHETSITIILLVWMVLVLFNGNYFDNVIFYLLLLGIPFILMIVFAAYHEQHKSNYIFYISFLVLWLLATFYASIKGVRFTLLLVVPLVISFGIGVYTIYQLLAPVLKARFFIPNSVVKVILVILFLALLIQPFREGYTMSMNMVPSISDQWYNLLVELRENSDPRAIINSWWDMGHWFKAIGNRATTLDGGNQNSPQAHWLGRLLLTDNEYESMGILRMLDCGANTAFNESQSFFNLDQVKTKKVIDQIILLERQEAKKYLVQQSLTEEQAEHILQYTHCEPPENYLVVSWDMIGKSGVWAHFGSWNFSRAQVIYLANKNMKEEAIQFMQDDMNFTRENAEQTYAQIKPYGSGDKANTWIAPWPSYKSALTPCVKSDANIICENDLVFNISDNTIYAPMPEGKKLYPLVSSFLDKDDKYTVIELEQSDENILRTNDGQSFGVTIFPDETGRYYTVLMDPVLAKSMFNRMFYFKTDSLACFDLFQTSSISSQQKIAVWKVDWSCDKKRISNGK